MMLLLAALLLAQTAPSPNPADAAFGKGDFSTAKTLYLDAVKANPKDAHALYRIAVIDAKTGTPQQALDDLKRYADVAAIPAGAYRTDAFSSFAALPGFDAFVADVERKLYPCRFDAAARAMDRWVGEWDVTSPSGPGGTSSSRIEKDLDGCAIVEHWSGAFGDRGTSLTSYDAASGRWFQHYVFDTARTTDWVGEAHGDSVVFETSGRTAGSQSRMTYVFLSDGRVEQRFESSSDGGKTWSVTGDLFYARKPARAASAEARS